MNVVETERLILCPFSTDDVSTFYHSFYFTIKNENTASQCVVKKCLNLDNKIKLTGSFIVLFNRL